MWFNFEVNYKNYLNLIRSCREEHSENHSYCFFIALLNNINAIV